LNSPGALSSRCLGRSSPVNCCPSIFFCKVIKAWISASGRGGHPGMCTSTGIYRSIPFSTLYPCLNGPPEIAHAPIAITYFGSGIWLYRRTTCGAIFLVTVPATIIKSACRGEGRKTSAPNRARSQRDIEAAIISIAQHARPKPSGQTEFLRPQLYRSSSVVVKTPCFCNSLLSPSSMLFPGQHAFPPCPDKACD